MFYWNQPPLLYPKGQTETPLWAFKKKIRALKNYYIFPSSPNGVVNYIHLTFTKLYFITWYIYKSHFTCTAYRRFRLANYHFTINKSVIHLEISKTVLVSNGKNTYHTTFFSKYSVCEFTHSFYWNSWAEENNRATPTPQSLPLPFM